MKGHSTLKEIFTNHIEQEPNESDLYQTRQELQEAEERGEGKINWDVWDKVAKETKHNITNKIRRFKTIIEAYDLNGKLINQYDSYKEAAKDWYTTPELISVYCRRKVPYIKHNVIFKTKKIRISINNTNGK